MTELAQKISDKKYSDGCEIERSCKVFTRKQVPDNVKLKILDIGCGTGLNASKLEEKGHDVVGLDISHMAMKKFGRLGFKGVQCNIDTGIPFHAECFDLVYASEVIEHLTDSDLFLSEIHRILKPSGKLVLSTINSAFWVFRVFALIGITVSEVQHPGHIRFFSKSSLKRVVEKCGFSNTHISGRNMYLIISGEIFQRIKGLLNRLGLKQEIRFKTKKPFWHVSHFSKNANALFSDTLILTAQKKRLTHPMYKVKAA